MRKGAFGFLSVVFVALLVVGPVLAHHSFAAQFDSTKRVTLRGWVTKIEWQNPHAYFYIDVKDEATGRFHNWALEMGAPSVLTRSGWTRNSLKIGDELIVEATRAKDGSNLANARTVTMAATGKRLGAGSSEGQIPQTRDDR